MPPKGKDQRGIFPIVTGTKNVKAIQLKETRSMEATPPKRTERVHNILFHDAKSQ